MPSVVEAEVAGEEVRAEGLLILPREPDGHVPDDRRSDRPGLTAGEHVHLGEPAVLVGVRIGAEVVRQVVHDRVEHAELAPDLVRRGAVEVDLDVVVVTVGRACLLA